MRETKDQTIIRLKREVAELKEAVRGQKRMAKEKIKESKEALIQSQSKSKADLRGQINKYKSDYNKLKEQYDRIRDKFYTLMMRKSRDKRELYSLWNWLLVWIESGMNGLQKITGNAWKRIRMARH